jgi:hypothetical protein
VSQKKMKGILALVGLVILLTAGYPTTDKSGGSYPQWENITTTGGVIGDNGAIASRYGTVFLSIGEVVSGSGVTTFEISFRKNGSGTSVLDTFALGNGVDLNQNFKYGIDSLNVLSIGAGANFLAEVTN